MKPTHIQFRWADAWILLSVIGASLESGTAILRDIIAVADFIQHAILTYGEADQGLARLIEAGHVKRNTKGFRPSKKVLNAYEAFSKHARKVREHEKEMERFLSAEPYDSNYCPPPDSAGLVISHEEFEAAVHAYLGQFGRRK